MQEYYKVLNISMDASNEEVESAYKALKEKYSRDRFLEGEEGNQAARNLTKLETAYQEIMASRKFNEKSNQNDKSNLSEVDALIKENKIAEAQDKLDNITERNAEWHYLQSVIFYKKNWINESKKQLEIAISIEPNNQKYANDYAKLKQKIEYTESQFKSGNSQNFNNQNGATQNRQMGNSDANNCATFCATWCCIDMMTDCLCSICCR